MSGGLASDSDALWLGVLGPVEARRGGVAIKLGGGKARAVLAMLALEPNRVVATSRLIDGIWGEDPPAGVQATLQVHVSNLRKALGGAEVVTRAPGYLLEVDPATVDLTEFEADLEVAHRAVAAADDAAARAAYQRALGRWRGTPLSDVLDAPFTTSAVPWLTERRALAWEEHADVAMRLGDHRALVADLEVAVSEAPHRERLWGQLMVALYRSGRQADALAAYQRARSTLGEDLGIDPGPDLRRLESQILAQDPELDGPVAPMPVPDPDDPGETYRAPVLTRCRLVLDDQSERMLEGSVVVGRHPDCEICLPDAAVSRRHVELRPAVGTFLLVDLGSANGTLVNGVPVVQHLLADCDVLGIGSHQLTFRADQA